MNTTLKLSLPDATDSLSKLQLQCACLDQSRYFIDIVVQVNNKVPFSVATLSMYRLSKTLLRQHNHRNYRLEGADGISLLRYG